MAKFGYRSPRQRLRVWPARGFNPRAGLWGACALVLSGCGSDAATVEETDILAGFSFDDAGLAASELPYAPCPAESLTGQFVIELSADYTRVGGKVEDRVWPTRVPIELAREGDCRLLSIVPATCTPACAPATELCDATATCVALPRPRDVGVVGVAGLVVPLTMRPNAVTGAYSNPAQPALPHPGFSPGADLRLATSGGDYAPFSLRGWGVSALTLAPAPIAVRGGSPVALVWVAPEVPGPARLHVSLNINHHGSSNASVECDFPDTGSAQIPVALVDALMSRGRSGFPTLTARRRSATSTRIEPGCVELSVLSEVTASVEVDGIVSCNVSSECAPGQSCLPVERFCQ